MIQACHSYSGNFWEYRKGEGIRSEGKGGEGGFCGIYDAGVSVTN